GCLVCEAKQEAEEPCGPSAPVSSRFAAASLRVATAAVHLAVEPRPCGRLPAPRSIKDRDGSGSGGRRSGDLVTGQRPWTTLTPGARFDTRTVADPFADGKPPGVKPPSTIRSPRQGAPDIMHLGGDPDLSGAVM